jgi:hypothetical protein
MIEAHADLRGYFRERLVAALQRRGVTPHEATEFYVVDLLARYSRVRPDDSVLRPLVYRMAEALETQDATERFRRFRDMGDAALYVCGFFLEYLQRRGVSRDYVVTMGGRAYDRARHLAGWGGLGMDAGLAAAYQELADRFDDFAHVLDEVREETTFRTPQDIVRLYDRWKRTGSPTLAARLKDEGVFPQREQDDGEGSSVLH